MRRRVVAHELQLQLPEFRELVARAQARERERRSVRDAS
jgi:hypothetical protein